MKFVVSSTGLLSHLQAINRVISSKSTLPILDNFLFSLEGNELTITASDLETTLVTQIQLENVDGDGTIAIEAKRLTDTLKEFSEQPLTFEIDLETLAVVILSENGKFSVIGQRGDDYPVLPTLKQKQAATLRLSPDIMLAGINKTLFATADDELRPVMNGIFIQLSPDNITFVASDAHKLVRYRRADGHADQEASFILPKKPASLLKNILPKEQNEITLEFDEKNAFFTLSNYKMVCRLVEGTYPNYQAVIPTDSPYNLIIDRVDFYNSLKRVSVFSNQASNLVKLQLSGNQITISAQDIDFSISAYERLNCQYEGDEMEIGFKSVFLVEILANMGSSDVRLELADPSRAGIVFPVQRVNENEDELMLLMPMMINV